MKLYLASTSPRRRQILNRLGWKYQTIKPTFLEPTINYTADAKKLSITIALLKTLSTARQLQSGCANCRRQTGIVLGFDTIVTINRQILGKPRNQTEARRMLNLLSNKTHQVITGIAIIRLPEYRILTDAEKTLVTFRKLTEKEIATYIESKEPYDKAGAYALQGKAGLFVKHINGCYLNVIGLPVNLLLAMLKKLNWQPENSG